MAGDHVRIVNEDRPDVHCHEKGEVEVLLDGEEVREDVVGEGLEVPVDRVECVSGEGSGYNPSVVWLVDVLVDEWVVFPPVDPVDAVVGEKKEPEESHLNPNEGKRKQCESMHVQWDRKEEPSPAVFVNVVIQL